MKNLLEKALQKEADSVKKQKSALNFTPKVEVNAHDLTLYEKAVFSWYAPEYIQHKKSPRWYLAAGIILLFAIILAVIFSNWTFAIAALVFAGVYHYIHEKHPPKIIKITISQMGIKVGNMIFPFSHIKAFWIIYQAPFIKTLNLHVKEHFFSNVEIQLGDANPVEVRQFLCSQVPEWEGKNEKLGDVILRLLKL